MDTASIERGSAGLPGRPPFNTPLDVEIVVPVHNQDRLLEASIRRLYGFLCSTFPYTWSILIADDASTDRTFATALRLSYELQGVELIHLKVPGRGRALRRAWCESDARVLCCMDVELSTDLDALVPLVAPLLCGDRQPATVDVRCGSERRLRTNRGRSGLTLLSPRRPMLAP